MKIRSSPNSYPSPMGNDKAQTISGTTPSSNVTVNTPWHPSLAIVWCGAHLPKEDKPTFFNWNRYPGTVPITWLSLVSMTLIFTTLAN